MTSGHMKRGVPSAVCVLWFCVSSTSRKGPERAVVARLRTLIDDVDQDLNSIRRARSAARVEICCERKGRDLNHAKPLSIHRIGKGKPHLTVALYH